MVSKEMDTSTIGLALLQWTKNSFLDLHISMYTTVIDGLFKCGKFDTARDLFNSLNSNGLYPDIVSYTAMIQGFLRCGLSEEAKEFISNFEKNSC